MFKKNLFYVVMYLNLGVIRNKQFSYNKNLRFVVPK